MISKLNSGKTMERKSPRTHTLLHCLLALSFIGSGTVSALQAADALLVRKSGPVQVRHKNAKRFVKAEAGAPLSFGDTVKTGAGAKAQILFTGGNAILIKESSTLRLNGKSSNILVNIPKGEFLIGIKQKLTRGQSFRVRTPAAVASIRGTLFWGLSDKDLNSTYACFESAVQITAKGQSVLLKPGEKTFIPYGKPPQAKEAANVPLDYMDTFAVDGSIEGLKEMVK
jgi:hypothetical protein